MQPAEPAFPHRSSCACCGSLRLEPTLYVKNEGIPHGEPGHNFQFDQETLAFCMGCQRMQAQTHSHDCYSQDESWDMQWIRIFDPSASRVLMDMIETNCPKPLDPSCGCELHEKFRKDFWRTYSNEKSQHGHGEFSWATLDFLHSKEE